VIQEQPGRIPAIASMCNLVFGVGFEAVDGAKNIVGSHQTQRG
jgi:hypothetical protein